MTLHVMEKCAYMHELIALSACLIYSPRPQLTMMINANLRNRGLQNTSGGIREPHNTTGVLVHDTDGLPEPIQEVEPVPETGRELTTLRIAVGNEGKLSEGKYLDLMHWCKAEADLLIISEGAWRWKSKPKQEVPGMVFSAPLAQRWGGVGMMCRAGLARGRKFRMYSSGTDWSVTSFCISEHCIIVGAYITPDAARDLSMVTDMLAQVTAETSSYAIAIAAGDWNSATGTASRAAIDAWAVTHGFWLANRGMKTHFSATDSDGTDIDLVFTRGCAVVSGPLVADRPLTGHSRLLMEVKLPHIKCKPLVKRINWGNVVRYSSEYTARTEQLLQEGRDLEECMLRAAGEIFGYTDGKSQRIPRSVRRMIRTQRRLLRRLARGSQEHSACLSRINALFAKWTNRGWRNLLRKLCDENLGQQAWAIVKKLSKPPVPTQTGIPDHEFASLSQETYLMNRTTRPEWQRIENGADSDSPLDAPFSIMEVGLAIATLPSRKAPGPDQLPYEAFKGCLGSRLVLEQLAKTFNRYLSEGYDLPVLPTTLVGIPKGPGRGVRTISLLNSDRKILEKCVMNRLQTVDVGIHDSQSGFCKKRTAYRCLIQLHLRILAARLDETPLVVHSFDVEKCFDVIPKPYIGMRMDQTLSRHCPRLARLAGDMMTLPVTGRIGDDHYVQMHTGAAQGGVMSPWVFNICDDALGRILGSDSLYKYADDNTTAHESLEAAAEAENIIKRHYAYYGARINESKTQRLYINISGQESGAIEVLGCKIDGDGVRMQSHSRIFSDNCAWLRTFSVANGLSTKQVLTLAYSKIWAKKSYGAPIGFPPLRLWTLAWLRQAREYMCAYQTSHTVSVVQAIGVLRLPMWWAAKATIKFYRTCLEDQMVGAKLRADTAATAHLRRQLNEFLAHCGITWEDISTSLDTNYLIHCAKVRYIEWMRQQMVTECARVGIATIESPRLTYARYLTHRLGRYGFPFQTTHLGPDGRLPAACFFCNKPGADSGAHLVTECDRVGERPTASASAWRLEDEAPPAEVRLVLQWMQRIWKERKQRREEKGSTVEGASPRTGHSTFLIVPWPRAARARLKRLRITHATIPDEPPPRRIRVIRPDPDATTPVEVVEVRETEPVAIQPTTPVVEVVEVRETEPVAIQPTTPAVEVVEICETEPVAIRPTIRAGARDVSTQLTEDDDELRATEPVELRPTIPVGVRRQRHERDEDVLHELDSPRRRPRLATDPLPSSSIGDRGLTTVPALPPAIGDLEPLARAGSVDSDGADDGGLMRTVATETSERTDNAEVVQVEQRKGRWTLGEDERLLRALALRVSLEETARMVGSRDVAQITNRMKTKEFSAKCPLQPTPPVRTIRQVRWASDEIRALEQGMRATRSCHDYGALKGFLLPHRTVASITAKINSLLGAGRIVVRGGIYHII